MHELPEGWQRQKLGEIAEIVGGSTPSKKVPEYWENGEVPWATPTDITKLPVGQRSIAATENRVTYAGLNETSLRLLPPGAVLMTSRATIGYTAINEVPITTNQGFANFLPYPETWASYLAYWLENSRETLRSISGGSTFLEVSKKSLKALPIALPPLPEQKKIAEVLGSVDEAIAATKAVIDQTKQVKKGLLQNLLTKGIGHTKFKQTELGEIPESWEICTVREVLEVQLGKMLSQKAKAGANPKPYLRNANVQWDRIETDDVYEMDFVGHEIEKFRLKNGDLIVCEGGEVGRCAIWNSEDEMYYQKALHRLRPRNGNVSSEFVKHVLTKIFRYGHDAKGIVGHNSIAHLTKKNLEAMKILVPPHDEQLAINHDLATVEDEQIKSETIAAHLEILKSGLMSELLTGRKRVEVPDA